MAALLSTPALAQQTHVPIIPMLIGPDVTASKDASKTISVVVSRGLVSNRPLRSNTLRNARTRMQQGGEVNPRTLRALAQAGDGLAAQHYVRWMLAQEKAANPSDLAYYAAIAIGTGRVWTLRNMIEAMHQLDPQTEPRARIRKYIQVLYPHAWAGNTLALQAVVEFNGEGRLFGPLSEKTRLRIQQEVGKNGDSRIGLGIAMGLLERNRASATPNPDDLAYARQLLAQATTSTHLAVATSAQNLLHLMDAQETGTIRANSS